MSDILNASAQRAELHRRIWAIADDVRGAVDGWDFKQYVLGVLFYRFISENMTEFFNKAEHEAGDPDFDYAKISDAEAEEDFKPGTVEDKGFFILPSQLFENVVKTADSNENLNTDLANIFNAIEASAVGFPSEEKIKGLFSNIDTRSNQLGGTVKERNQRLADILKGINSINFGNFQENEIDAFGDAYEYLISNYASNAGKSGGEYFTPQSVSKLLAKLAMHNKTKVNKVYDPTIGETTFYVNPKAGKTNADITEPTITANTGFKVADPKWSPKFDKASTTAITADATYTAQYTKVDDVVNGHDENGNVVPKPEGYNTVTFDLDGKGTTKDETVFYVNPEKEVTLTAPTVKGINGYTIKAGDEAWNPKFVATATYKEDKTFVAQYTFDKDVVPQGPGEEKPVVPNNFVKVEFKKGDHGVISSEETTIYWVDPSKEVTVTAPAVIADKDYKHTGWDKALTAKFVEATDITALYKKIVVPGPDQPTKPDPSNPNGPQIPDPDYVKVEFLPGDHGKFEQVDVAGANGSTEKKDQVTVFWVLKDEKASFNAPKATPDANYNFKAWNPKIQETYNVNMEHTATYEAIENVSDTEVPGFNKVTFKPGDHGTLSEEKSVWVRPNTLVDISDKAPTVTPNKDYSHTGWEPGLVGKFADGTEIVAQYSKSISEVPVPGWTEILFNSGEHGRFDNGTRNVRWVDPNVAVALNFMTDKIVPYINYSFDKWTDKDKKVVDLSVAKKYTDNIAFTGTYKSDISNTPEAGKVEINFAPGAHGKFADGAKTKIYVTKDKLVDLTEFAPTVIPNQGFGHSGWEPALKGTFTGATTITAQYKAGTFNKDGIKEIIVLGPTKMTYKEGDKLDLTGLKVIAIDDAGLQEKYDGVDKIKEAGFTIEPADKKKLTYKDDNGKPIKVTKGEATGQTETVLSVAQLQTPTPTIVFAANQNTVGSDGSTPTQTAKNVTTVKFTVVNKPTTVYVKYTVEGEATPREESFEIKADDEATKTVDLQVKLPVGAEVQVLAKDADKTLSEPATAEVVRDADNNGTADNKTPLDDPVIDDIKAEAEKILVTPPKGAIELVISESGKNVNASTPLTLKKDGRTWKTPDEKVIPVEDGKLAIPKGDFQLDEYNVVKAVAKGDPDTTLPSEALKAVGPAADTKAPAKPVVDPPIAGDTDVKVKTPAEPDAKTITVVITKPGVPDKEIVVTKGDDGKWKTPDGTEVPEENGKLVVPVTPKLDTNDTVTVTTTDDSGNPSEANEQTVVERQQLPKPTINPIKTGEKTVAGKAEKAATVDIYKKNAQDGFDIIATDVGVSPDGSYTYNNPDGFKDGDVIKVVSKKPGMIENNETTTVGVDTSGLDKAIQDGKDALDPEKGGKNNGTPEDKALEDAIKKGEEEKNKKPPKQEDVDKAKEDIEKAIDDKKKADEARDKLQEKINEANDKKNDPEYPNKPKDVKDDLDKAAKDGQKVHDDNNKSKEDIDKEIEKIQDKIDEYNKQQIGVNIDKIVSTGKDIKVIVTAPNAKVEVFKSEFDYDTFEDILTPLGEGTSRTRIIIVSLDEPLPKGTNLLIKVTHPDYLSYENTEIVE